MQNDLISRSALLNEYRDFKDMDCPSGHTVTVDYMIELAEDAPAVDAEVVRHGRWIVECETHGNPYDDGQWEEWMALCSECGRVICLDDFECAKGNVGKEIAKFPYCHCGCKMDAEVQDVPQD